jgi:outer membrane receptor for ferrienterochelin and colicins
MELQQKEQQIIFSGGTLFYEDRWGGELQWEKNTVEVAKYMAKAFIPSAGNYCAYELPIAEKCCFRFLIQITTKTLCMVIFLPS